MLDDAIFLYCSKVFHWNIIIYHCNNRIASCCNYHRVHFQPYYSAVAVSNRNPHIHNMAKTQREYILRMNKSLLKHMHKSMMTNY